MKYETNFTEMSKIFSAIAKADAKYAAYTEAAAAYEAASNAYAESGYAISKGYEMSGAYELRETARRNMLNSFKDLTKMLGFNPEESWHEADTINMAKSNPDGFLYRIKRDAIALATKGINF